MKARNVRWGVLVASLALALTACGGGGGNQLAGGGNEVAVDRGAKFEPGSTMANLQQAGKIRIGAKFDQPLFGLQGLDGKPQGFDVQIAKIVAAKMGLSPEQIEWVETPSKTREEVIEQQKVDMVVATYTINDNRKERISFAGPYYQAGQDLMVARDNTGITGPESLRPTGAKVCSVTGSTPAEEIKKYVDPQNLVLFDVYSKCSDALRTGQVQAVTTDNVILMGLVENGGGRFKLVGKPFTAEPYGIGIKKGDVAFCRFIDDALTEAQADGSYQKAWQTTAGKVSPQVPPLPQFDACG
ncbi:MAG: glutamate ABC transporter substrate-binding protein [Saccharopolyspora sp.]|uniref:glutamate ABC transporter substrate-binding protein n=1 Tax=Saccharopolyspora TaxID=1835 RepID=UPI00190DCB7D|nr:MULTISPECIES: glutamate ABC transporter substrate-binding protein [unclassified Saccharopolyspora]MBK0868540.1 glutamate ABC transporter substrate-binding protein [Saccharopolyspora sp. HNM0986]MBQ6642296.1 glutamate ABC transporter substrate-binding protein [Saccharopolyspora sp.]